MEEFSVSITPEAAEEFKALLEEQGFSTESHGLFMGVVSGGCCSLSYSLNIMELSLIEIDIATQSEGIEIIVDQLSAPYINGSTIEWSDDVLGGGFKIENPQANGGCGCGKSFSAEGVEPQEGCGSCSNG